MVNPTGLTLSGALRLGNLALTDDPAGVWQAVRIVLGRGTTVPPVVDGHASTRQYTEEARERTA